MQAAVCTVAHRTNDVILKTQNNPDEGIIQTAPYLDAPFKVKDHRGRHDHPAASEASR